MDELKLRGDGPLDGEPQLPQDRAMDRLVQKDRILVEARMLPKTRKLHKREIDAVRHRLRELLDQPDSGVSIAMVANECNYSAGTLSEWVRDKYGGKVDLVTHAVNLWLERHARRESTRGRRDYVETWVCETMAAIIRFAYRRERMAAVVAPSGSGKDMVIAVLAEELNGYIIGCHRGTTVKLLVTKIGQAVGLTERQLRAGAGAVVELIVGKLRDKSCTIFLNEAQQLGPECASVIRHIHDETHVPIIMLGSRGIFDFIDDSASGGGQFSRRTIKCNIESKMKAEIDPDSGGMGRRLYSADEIRRFLAMKQVRLADDDAFQMLHKIACLVGHGTMGLLGVLVEGMLDLNGNDVEITTQFITEQLYTELEDEAGVILGKLDIEQEEGAPRAAIA